MKMINIQFFKHKKILSIISDVLILLFSFIVGFYHHAIYDFSSIAYYSIYFILVISIALSIYIKLYNWRKLELSVLSFIFFSINIAQLLIYIIAIRFFFNNTYKEISNAIYLENLSIISQYRYLILTLISIFFMLGFLILKKYNYDIPSSFTYPYLKEEIRKILYTWNEMIGGPFCSFILKQLLISKYNRIMFFFFHFVIFYILRFIPLIFLLNFAFFDGDFRLILYCLPLAFIIWLFKFIDYYFVIFFEGTCEYIRSLVSVVDHNKPFMTSNGILKTTVEELDFKLTQEALDLGYTEKYDGDYLSNSWLQLANLSVSFLKYQKHRKHFSIFFFLLQLIIWIFLVHYYFLNDKTFIGIFSTTFITVFKPFNMFSRYFSAATPCRAPKEIYFIKPPFTKQLAQITRGGYNPGHGVILDKDELNPDDPKEVRYYGQLTHGQSTPANPSAVLDSSKDFNGNPRPQNIVPATEVLFIPENWTKPVPVQGSKAYLEQPEVRVNLAKLELRDEDT